jgi:thioredoxin 1
MLLEEYSWKDEVLESKEPVVVDFWAPWCGPCRMMDPVLKALARDYKVCKVNTDSNPELANHYGISAIPALFIFKDGKVVAQHVGMMSEAELRAELEQLSRA